MVTLARLARAALRADPTGESREGLRWSDDMVDVSFSSAVVKSTRGGDASAGFSTSWRSLADCGWMGRAISSDGGRAGREAGEARAVAGETFAIEERYSEGEVLGVEHRLAERDGKLRWRPAQRPPPRSGGGDGAMRARCCS